ncbi:hypothetical protein JCM11641_005836 [Rhodosporidiobolus odoratus]
MSGHTESAYTHREQAPSQHAAAFAAPSPASSSSSRQNQTSQPPRQVRFGSDRVYPQAQSTTSEGDESKEAGIEELDDEVNKGGVLAISSIKHKLGCCYYEPETQKLRFIEDQAESSSWDLTTLILEQLLPTTVLTSSSADVDFLSSLEATLSTLPVSASSSSATSHSSGDVPVKLEYRPTREFYAGQGRLALSELHVAEGGIYLEQEDQSETLAAGSPVDNDEYGSEDDRDTYAFGPRRKKRRLGCAGALLTTVSRSRSSAGELDGEGFEVTGLELLKLDKLMHINSDALASLQIFSDESHASMHTTATKEGLSLFGIVNVARTPLGRLLMKQWFIRPSLELMVIEKRHLAVECFLRSENHHIVDAIQSNFRLIKNTPRVLKSLASGRGGLKDWQTMWQVLYGSIMIRDAALNLVHRKGVEVVHKLLDSFDPLAFKDIGSMINDIIDWEESALQKGRVCVCPGVDADLDDWRRQLNGLSSLLSKVADSISATLPASLGVAELSLVYFPQLGYLITVPYEPEVAVAGKYDEAGWDFQFVTELRAYFKSDKCYDLDKHIGDLHSFIAVHALLIHLLTITDQLHCSTAAISELDCLIAFAKASRLYEWNRPEMVEEPKCEIVGGRHPLAELCVESFVRNDTYLVGGQGAPDSAVKQEDDIKPLLSDDDDEAGMAMAVDAPAEVKKSGEKGKAMLIITGANFSGKSVYLKQVALIVFLAHVGCFVPAESATIGLTDRIMTRVSTRESVTRGASAFMIDLQQVSFLLRNHTTSSLILLDEFGKGTEADDGAGLFCGVIEYLVSLGREMPRVVVATHFQHVFLNGLLSRRLPCVELAHMEIHVAEEQELSASGASGSSSNMKSKSEIENLTYLYRLSPGLSLSSHASACASLFGLPLPIVQRASYITHLLSTFELDALNLEELSEKEKEQVKEGERAGRGVLGWELEEGMDVGELERLIKEALRQGG